jgi:peptide/nickel transport system permease protein
MTARTAGAALFSAMVAAAVAAPLLTPHSPIQQFDGHENAPPMLPHIFTIDGRLTRPVIYPVRLVDRLERRFAEDTAHPIPLRFFADGRIVSVDESQGPWLPLGGDPLRRDVFARLLYGARLSLGVACIAALGAVILGVLIGAPAGFFGGRIDAVLMALADFVLVLPAIYVVLAFRAALPLVLTIPQVFGALVLVLAAAGWPVTARGVRAIIAAEGRKEYAEAAYALGAGRTRILLRHLLPATSGFLAITVTMMIPAFLLTEGTMTLVGMGFPVPAATWGAMLHDAWDGAALTDAPWLLSPAFAIVYTMLSLHLLTSGEAREGAHTGTFS